MCSLHRSYNLGDELFVNFLKTELTKVIISAMEFLWVSLHKCNLWDRSQQLLIGIAMFQLWIKERRLNEIIFACFFLRFILSSKERVNATKSWQKKLCVDKTNTYYFSVLAKKITVGRARRTFKQGRVLMVDQVLLIVGHLSTILLCV